MNFIELTKQAIRSIVRQLKHNPVESWLRVLQVVLGISVMIIGISLFYSTAEKSSFKSHLFEVKAGTISRTQSTSFRLFTPEFSEAVVTQVADVDFVTVFQRESWAARLEVENVVFQVSPTAFVEWTYPSIIGLDFIAGSFLTDSDKYNKRPVVAISSEVAKQLFSRLDVVGEQVTISAESNFSAIRSQSYDVIGVFETSSNENISVPAILLPYWMMEGEGSLGQLADTLLVSSKDGRETQAREQVIHVVEDLYESASDHNQPQLRLDSSFHTINPEQSLINDPISNPVVIIINFFGFLGIAISLIGTFTSSLIKNKQNRYNISICRALGSDKWTIKMQTALEAGIITLIAGSLGGLLSYLFMTILSHEARTFTSFFKIDLSFRLYPASSVVMCMVILGGLMGYMASSIELSDSPVDGLRK